MEGGWDVILKYFKHLGKLLAVRMITIPHLRPSNPPHTVAHYFNATRGLKFHSLLTQPSCRPSFICSPLSLSSSRRVHLANSAAWRPTTKLLSYAAHFWHNIFIFSPINFASSYRSFFCGRCSGQGRESHSLLCLGHSCLARPPKPLLPWEISICRRRRRPGPNSGCREVKK